MVNRSERLDSIVKRLDCKVISPETIKKEISLLGDPSDVIYVSNEVWKNIFMRGLKCSVKTILFLRDVIYAANEKMRAFSTKDYLTGLFNRRCFDSNLKMQLASTYRNLDEPFSVIMFDIDHFKIFNDTYGHNAGDIVLEKLSDIISESIRDSDVAFRYGGEEFVILLSDTNQEVALDVASRLNSEVANTDVIFVDEKGKKHRKPVTVSVGVVEVNKENPVWLLYGSRGQKLILNYVDGQPDSDEVLDNYIKKYSMNFSLGQGEILTRKEIKKRVKKLGEFVKAYLVEHNFKVSDLSIKQCAVSWIIHEVDSLAYHAKECGRNRVAYMNCNSVKTVKD